MGRVACVLAVVALCAPACGDSPTCGDEVLVAVQTSAVTEDIDPVTPGIQTDVHVRTNLRAGDTLTLLVRDDTGVTISTVDKTVDDTGDITFAQVTVPVPRAILVATGAGTCGTGEDTLDVEVLPGESCDLQLSPPPSANAFYAPAGVYAAADDPKPAIPGFQATVLVSTLPGALVEVFATTPAGDVSLGTVSTGPDSLASFSRDLPDGPVTFRAVCHDGGVLVPSQAASVFVDTTPPKCAFTAPAPGSTITPGLDTDHDLGDGVNLAIAATVGGEGSDTDGESATMAITPAADVFSQPDPTTIDATGSTIASAVLTPPATPETYTFTLTGRDHAGNTCSSTVSYDVVFDGCDIQVVSPTAPVAVDADGDATDGAQVDIGLQVSTACAGRTVTSACGSDSPSGVVAADGSVSLRATVCDSSPCQVSVPCTFDVATAAGIHTQASATLAFDNAGPDTSVSVVQPALACGAQVTPAVDVDATADGVQVVADVVSPDAATKQLQVTNSGGTSTSDASSDVTVTLAAGANQLVGIGVDALGNRTQSLACTITLADLAVSFSPPAADGQLSRADGSVSGGAITLPLCGTVNRTGASVAVSVDGGAAVPATVTGTSWCVTETLAETPPAHTVVATASAGASFGSATLVLAVDLTPPTSPGALVVSSPNRETLHATWTAPSDNGAAAPAYVMKVASVPLSDANFDSAGVVVPLAAPGAPGTAESVDIAVQPGTPRFVGIAAVDAAGNRSVAAIAGPVTPAFVQSGFIQAPDVSLGSEALGFAIAHGKFNDDEFDDVVVSAPTQGLGATAKAGAVYVYFGGPAGISATPGLVIVGPSANAKLGSGLAAVRWSSASRDDLVVGAPGADGGAGRVFVFDGGAAFGTGTRAATTADLIVAVNPTAPGYFAGGALGTGVAAADFDGDGVLDLVASLPGGGGGAGGVVVVYGLTAGGNVLLSDVDASGANGAVAELVEDPDGATAPGRQLGFYVHAVGPTQGAFDVTDDLVAAYIDDVTVANDSLFVLRGDGVRPAAAGVSLRPFTPGRDVRIDYAVSSKATEFASQATSLDDQDGDGARDLVVSGYRNGNGQVLVISGDVLGSSGVARTSDAGVVISTINAGANVVRFGSALATHDDFVPPDVDGDGREDLFVTGVLSGAGRGFVWFGGSIPHGVTTAASAQYVISAPAKMLFNRQAPVGIAGSARWVGDTDGDGLADVCWASPFDNSGDGGFEILSD